MATQVAISPKLDGGVFRINPTRAKYSDDLVREILMRIADGETYESIRRSDPDKFPHASALGDWLNASPALAVAHARAREFMADAIAEETLRIVDAEPERLEDRRIDAGSVQWAKMRAEQRMKLLAKWAPEKYGEKLLHAGHDGKEIKIDQRFDIRAIADQLRAATRQRVEGQAPGEALIEHQPGDDGSDLV